MVIIMLQHNKKVDKSQPNTFVDGVHVKISEQYKPPRRVVLPVSCQNCTPGEALYSEYDFKLEENVINKLAEWKSARREQVERRKQRLKAEAKVCEEIEHLSNVSIGPSQNEGAEHNNVKPNHNQLTDSVLTPIRAKQTSPSNKPVSTKNFNFSDFESDNSSPFDNMELQTINDMEVLATILTKNNMEQSIHNNNNIIDKDLGKNCLVLNNRNSDWGYAPLNGYSDNGYLRTLEFDNHQTVVPSQVKDLNQYSYYPNSENIQVSNYGLNDFSNQFGAAISLDQSTALSTRQEPDTLGKNKLCSVNVSKFQDENVKSVPDIMQELEKELKESREREEEVEKRNKLAFLKQTIQTSITDKKLLPESSRRINTNTVLTHLPDPSSSLSSSAQKQVRYISDMGFPLPRVARAWQMFNGNDKKILEFLLQVQSLEEKNYPGDLIEKALIINELKLKESLKFLEAMVVLLDLGFDEDRAEEALIAAGSDRDKALDMLIS